MSARPELAWFKSSYSGSQGDDCVEVAVTEQAVRTGLEGRVAPSPCGGS
jgi:hypothetical protein